VEQYNNKFSLTIFIEYTKHIGFSVPNFWNQAFLMESDNADSYKERMIITLLQVANVCLKNLFKPTF
jgi:hypothetical protein